MAGKRGRLPPSGLGRSGPPAPTSGRVPAQFIEAAGKRHADEKAQLASTMGRVLCQPVSRSAPVLDLLPRWSVQPNTRDLIPLAEASEKVAALGEDAPAGTETTPPGTMKDECGHWPPNIAMISSSLVVSLIVSTTFPPSGAVAPDRRFVEGLPAVDRAGEIRHKHQEKHAGCRFEGVRPSGRCCVSARPAGTLTP